MTQIQLFDRTPADDFDSHLRAHGLPYEHVATVERMCRHHGLGGAS